jgi:hypothetical protein
MIPMGKRAQAHTRNPDGKGAALHVRSFPGPTWPWHLSKGCRCAARISLALRRLMLFRLVPDRPSMTPFFTQAETLEHLPRSACSISFK